MLTRISIAQILSDNPNSFIQVSEICNEGTWTECVKCSELTKFQDLTYAVETALNDENGSTELDIYKYAFQALTNTDRETLFLKKGETGTLIDTVEIYHPE